MRCRLLVLDLDGTAITDGMAPTPGVLEAVAAAQARGVQVVLATGRSYRSTSGFAATFGTQSPVICYQGALVKQITGTRDTLLARGMPREPLMDLLRFADDRDWEASLFSERSIYIPRMWRTADFYRHCVGPDVEIVGPLADYLEILDRMGLPPLKCMLIGQPEENEGRRATLEEKYGSQLSIVRSHPLFVEAVSPGVSKGHALTFLAERLHVSREETVAVGDSGNDLSMIRWAGIGVAMGNGTSDVRAAADWVAPPVEEDGVVAVVERYVLRNGRG